jgi:hypothetical protein
MYSEFKYEISFVFRKNVFLIDEYLAACYWKPSIDLRGEVRKARGLAELVDLLRVDECDSVVNASAIALRNLAIDQKNCDVLGGWAVKELVAVLPDPTEQINNRRRHSDETICTCCTQ